MVENINLHLYYFDVFCVLISSHVEGPDRVMSIMHELEKQDLISHCVRVEVRLS